MSEIIYFFNQLNSIPRIIESIAVISSVIYVILAAKQNIWCWSFAIISTILYIYICLTAKLFAETALQFFYLAMAGYGYSQWNGSEKALSITRWNITNHLFAITLGAILTLLIAFYLKTYTEAEMPIIDSFTTVFSIIATYMVTRKVLENWLYWIAIDSISIYLYLNRDLHLTSLLFVLYTIIAIFGYFSWWKKIKIHV